MNEQKLTTEQIKEKLNEVLKMENDTENKFEKKRQLLQLKCRLRQLAFYEADDMENIIVEELSLIDELDTLTKENPGETFLPKAKARMKVIASTCMAVFRRAGVSMASIDATRIARLISFLSGYSETNIRLYLRDEMTFAPDDLEAAQAEALLMAVGISEKLVLKI